MNRLSAACSLLLAVLSLQADTAIEALERQNALLEQRIEAPEARSKEISGRAAPTDAKGTMQLLDDKTVMTVGGRIEFNALYAVPEGTFGPASIPLERPQNGGHLSAHMRESRFWMKTRTPSEQGMVRALMEFDLYGSEGSETTVNPHNPRIRHAYVEVNGFTVGQTNSLFTTAVAPDTIIKPVDESLVRQPLLSVAFEAGEWLYACSVEQPETMLVTQSGGKYYPDDDRLPDLVGRVQWFGQDGELSVAAMVRELRADSGASKEESAVGWGVNASARYTLPWRDDLRAGVQYGEGIGRYVAYTGYTSGTVGDDGSITLQPLQGYHLAYRHWWDRSLRSTVAYASVSTENDEDAAQTLDKSAYSLHANLIWNIMPHAMAGLEYAYGEREIETAEKGTMEQWQFRIRYEF